MSRAPVIVRAVALSVAAVLATGTARANPLDAFGFGSRETALAGAAAADTRGVAANYYNPASVARSPGLEISIGYMSATHRLMTSGRDNRVDPVRGLNLGFVVPGRLFQLPFAFGFALHLPDDRISRVRALRQEEPRWELYDNRNQRLYLAANLGVRPLRWLELGGGLSFMASTRGALGISGEANIVNTEQSALRHTVDADLTAVRYPQFGARVDLGDDVSLAAVYRGQFRLRLDLDAEVRGDLQKLTTARYALQTRSVNNFLPQQVVLGSSVRLLGQRKNRPLRLNFDLTWVNWSAYEPPVAAVDATLDIPPPAGGWPAGITPPSQPVKVNIVPLRMKDRLVPRVGAEYKFNLTASAQLAFRLGYEYAASPVEAQTGVTNYIDRDRHSVSWGAGVRLGGQLLGGWVRELSLDTHAQLSVLPTEVTEKADPSDFVGDYAAGGHILNLGLMLTTVFGR